MNLRPDYVPFYELHGQLIAHEILLKSSQQLPLANIAIKNASNPPLLPTPDVAVLSNPRNSSTNNFGFCNGNRRQRGPCQICGLLNHTTDHC